MARSKAFNTEANASSYNRWKSVKPSTASSYNRWVGLAYFDNRNPAACYAPAISNPLPLNTLEDAYSEVSFNIENRYYQTARSNEIDVNINGINVIVDGIFQAGYDGPNSAITPTADGYSVVVDFLNAFPAGTVSCQAYAGNGCETVFHAWEWTARQSAAYLTNVSPAAESTAAVDSIIRFDIIDVDADLKQNSIQVTINGQTVLTNGTTFASGWQGASSSVTAITDGYRVVIEKESDFVFKIVSIEVECEDVLGTGGTPQLFTWWFDSTYVPVPDIYWISAPTGGATNQSRDGTYIIYIVSEFEVQQSDIEIIANGTIIYNGSWNNKFSSSSYTPVTYNYKDGYSFTISRDFLWVDDYNTIVVNAYNIYDDYSTDNKTWRYNFQAFEQDFGTGVPYCKMYNNRIALSTGSTIKTYTRNISESLDWNLEQTITPGFVVNSRVDIDDYNIIVGSSAWGKVKVYNLINDVWTETLYINQSGSDRLGNYVAIDGEFCAVSEELLDNGAELQAGAIYVYKNSYPGWALEDTIQGAIAGQTLGIGLDIENVSSGEYRLAANCVSDDTGTYTRPVLTYYTGGNAGTVIHDQQFINIANQSLKLGYGILAALEFNDGYVHVYRRDNTVYTPYKGIEGPNNSFGYAIAIVDTGDGYSLYIEDAGADDYGTNAGMVYKYNNSNPAVDDWTLVRSMNVSEADDGYGQSIMDGYGKDIVVRGYLNTYALRMEE